MSTLENGPNTRRTSLRDVLEEGLALAEQYFKRRHQGVSLEAAQGWSPISPGPLLGFPSAASPF
jgi:hypothetical protein